MTLHHTYHCEEKEVVSVNAVSQLDTVGICSVESRDKLLSKLDLCLPTANLIR
jgi:hypothetical protein